ncbi:MAG TPA: hypothetical protein VE593_01215 [Nitrososphaeraceae archaeon]|nr:hypothetical protein [Nitrososphaeraceae archaeon]
MQVLRIAITIIISIVILAPSIVTAVVLNGPGIVENVLAQQEKEQQRNNTSNLLFRKHRHI